MFEDAPIDSLLGHVRGCDFESLPVVETGFVRVEAIVALDRVIRAARWAWVRVTPACR
jgi:hypothetical protein